MATYTGSKKQILEKLDPQHLRLSPKMRWIIDSVTGRDFGARGPRGEKPGPISITSDSFVVAGSMFIGSAADLDQNINGVLDAVEATAAEREAFKLIYAQHVTDWRTR